VGGWVGSGGGEEGALKGSAGRSVKLKLSSGVSGRTWGISITGEGGELAGSAGRSSKLNACSGVGDGLLVGNIGGSSDLSAGTDRREGGSC
jgi:hypothetical protein